MHHHSIRPFYHIRATIKRKTWDGITLQVNEAKLRMERGETCEKIHARAMV